MAKITYACSLEAFNEKFILTARAKGCSETRILWVHVWRRIRPQVTESVYGLIPLMISNLLLVEKIFFYPGLSFNLFKALTSGDMYLFLGLTIGLAVVYSLSVLAVDASLDGLSFDYGIFSWDPGLYHAG
jgi:ABC-type dipeptide/oligopeptide/nickel transport system permease component